MLLNSSAPVPVLAERGGSHPLARSTFHSAEDVTFAASAARSAGWTSGG